MKGGRKRSRAPLLSELRELRAAEESGTVSLAALELTEAASRARDKSSSSAAAREAIARVREIATRAGDRTVTVAEARAVFPAFAFLDNAADLQFVPPREVEVMGALRSDTVVVSEEEKFSCLDLAAVIPVQSLRNDDRVATRYHEKRVLFLAELANRLRRAWPEAEVFPVFSFGGDARKPLLGVRVPNMESTIIRIFVGLNANANKLPLAKLIPKSDSNAFFLCSIAEDSQLIAHAQAQEAICHLCPCARDALVLIRRWCAQRREKNGGGGGGGGEQFFFSPFQGAMFLSFLITSGRIPPPAPLSSALRIFFSLLSLEGTFAGGVFWDAGMPEAGREMFREAFEVAFVDESGAVNVAARLSGEGMIATRREAALAVAQLDRGDISSLLSSPPPFVLRYDVLLELPRPLPAPAFPAPPLFANRWRNDAAQYLAPEVATLRNVCGMLRRGLGTRCLAIAGTLQPDCALVGIVLDSANGFRKLDAGPPADDTAAAAAFRAFWGSKAELRRFRDGSVVEAAVWECAFEERRDIPARVAGHLLEHHFAIVLRKQRYCDLDRVLPRHGEERQLQLMAAFGQLSQTFRQIEHLPLPILDIAPLEELSSSVFPPLASPLCDGPAAASDSRQTLAVCCSEFSVTFQASSAWPSEPTARRHVQNAFRQTIGEKLARQFQIISVLQSDCLDVLFRGFVFRMRIAEGKESERRAKHAGVVLANHLRNNAFGGACRLAQRFLASHLLLGKSRNANDNSANVSPNLIEAIVSAVFFRQPFAVPAVGFVRFLQTVGEFPWEREPLVAPWSAEEDAVSANDLRNVGFELLKKRGGRGPVVVSSADPHSHWSKNVASVIWSRVVKICRAALPIVLRNDDQIFRIFIPNYADYDLLLRLRPETIPNAWQNVGEIFANDLYFFEPPVLANRLSLFTVVAKRFRKDNSELLIAFDPVNALLEALTVRFGNFFLFFRDVFGGSTIAAIRRIRKPIAASASSNSVISATPLANGLLELNRENFLFSVRSLCGDMLLEVVEQWKE